jgi:hypothetical protein
LKGKILSLLSFAAGKFLPVFLKGFVPSYKHFGQIIHLKHNGFEIIITRFYLELSIDDLLPFSSV